MESLNQFVNSLAPKLSHWRRDFHHYAESGWVEFRTATLVAEELQQLGYSLALGREVVNESSRMGLLMNSLYNANSSALVNRVR
ncbi:putative amidohydrolase [Escherichia coli]|uniref:Putative amidohydrolase n=1 Tax=Escherichia coli TaxID=562 RepID=A0A376ZYJ5_ECOLX|nr:putative amidohydrolase [Escherichia coli]